MDYNLYSFSELQKKYKISQTLLEYLNIEIIKKGRASYITQESFDKVLKFKEENPNTRVVLQKYTFMKKYGVENPQQLKEIKDKTNKTIKEKYGVDNVSQLNSIKEKKFETLQKHFGKGVTNPMNCEEIVQKVKDNWENKSQEEKDILIEKTKQTKLERYGNENYNNGKSISETKSARTQEQIDEETRKSKQTKLEKYGDENYQNYEKGIKTKLRKYGVKSFTNSEKAMQTKIKNNTVINKINYKYNDLEFASSWELYYYIYQKEILHNNIQKGKIFEYEYDKNKHFYYCDFLVNDENIEIKGNQLLDESNNLKQMKTREWDICKQKCMEQNNVKIISEKEIKPIIKIVKNIFGKNYIEGFKIIK